MAALALLVIRPAAAQRETPTLRPADGAVLAAGAALFLTPHVFDINRGPPACAPCDRRSVPWFDRWAISQPREPWGPASTLVLLGGGVAAVWDLLDGATNGSGEATVLGTSTLLAVSVTELLKAITSRNRPIMYTALAPRAAGAVDARRSWPSGHSAAAFALATSYAASLAEHGGPAWRQWVAVGTAMGVGSLRVVAGRHFPSDVAAGALVGALSVAGVHAIRF